MLKKYLHFVAENASSNSLILPKGSTLFHSSVEDVVLPLTVGSYDKVLWTAEDSGTSQMYIPVSTHTIHVSTESLVRPIKDEQMRNIQAQLGIVYDYSSIAWHNNVTASYKSAPIFSDIEEERNRHHKAYYELSRELNDMEKNHANAKDIAKKQAELAAEQKETVSTKYDKKINDLVNNILQNKFGYNPNKNNDNNHNFDWSLKIETVDNGYALLPANSSARGKLFILTLNRDFKFYDYASGRDGDLIDLDYHKLELFRRVEVDGYDGIIINDFAQSNLYGNFGHKSYGIFKNAIKDLSVESIDAQHPSDDWSERMHKYGDYRSEEYIKNQKGVD